MQPYLKNHKPQQAVGPALVAPAGEESLIIGCLLLDHTLQVIHADDGYLRFHAHFSDYNIQTGKPVHRLMFSNFPPQFFDELTAFATGKAGEAELRLNDPHCQTISYRLVLHPTDPGENTPGGIGVFIYKSGMATENGMQHLSPHLYEVLVHNSPDVFQLANAAFIVTYTSSAVESVLGYTPQHFVGKSVLESIHPDDRSHVQEWLISLRSIKEHLQAIEYRVKNKYGKWIWIENMGRNLLHHPEVKGIVLNFRNIQPKKIADHTLIQTEQRLSMLLNNTEESFIIINTRLRVVSYNKAAQVHSPFFFCTELQSGMSLLDLVRKPEVDDYISLIEEVFTGQEVARETIFTDDKHIEHIYSHIYRPVFDNNGEITGVFITSTNITDRKKLTMELAINSQRLETAQQIAKLAYFEYNFLTKEYYCSPQFYTILGVDEAEHNCFEECFIYQIVHPDDQEMVKKKIDASLNNGEDFNLEFRIQSGDAEKVIVAIGAMEKDPAGKLQKITLTIQDVTDSKMSLLAIETLETRFRSLFENSIDGVLLSRAEGEILSVNPSLCRMLGYHPDEVAGLHRCDLIDETTAPVIEMMEQRTRTGSFMGELMIRHKKGYYIPAEVTSVQTQDAKGLFYYSSIIRDITEKKKIETEQKALTEELLKNNQDLQQFSFITSHNLRAPVANLISLLSLYNKENPAEEFNEVLIEKFEEATQQLNQTLNDLVNVLVIKTNNALEKEVLSFTVLYNDVVTNLAGLIAEQDAVIEADFSEVDEVLYNRIHIESIFLNMISNAIRYRSPLRCLKISIKSFKRQGWTELHFADNGMGMDLKRYGDRLFGLYQRFHENKEGKGLGLYMTRSQVLANGGKIEVDSEPGVGTTFRIFIKTD